MDKAFEKAVLSTCGYMDDPSKKTALKIAKQFKAIVDYCSNGSDKIINIIVDKDNGIVFPVFSQDTVKRLVDRYVKLYPNEAKIMIKSFAEKGKWTGARLMMLRSSMPPRLYQAGQMIDKQYWDINDGEHLNEYEAYCPKLTTRGR